MFAELLFVLLEGIHCNDLGGALRAWWQVATGKVTPEDRAYWPTEVGR